MTGAGEALEAALESLKPERIVGAGGLRMRDEAMTAGEKGAFGSRDLPHRGPGELWPALSRSRRRGEYFRRIEEPMGLGRLRHPRLGALPLRTALRRLSSRCRDRRGWVDKSQERRSPGDLTHVDGPAKPVLATGRQRKAFSGWSRKSRGRGGEAFSLPVEAPSRGCTRLPRAAADRCGARAAWRRPWPFDPSHRGGNGFSSAIDP